MLYQSKAYLHFSHIFKALVNNIKKRVLICDDDTDILFICSYIFEKQGIEVVTRTHCNNIVETVKDLKPDIILMDNWIPESGGIVASRTIKEDRSLNHIPIVYFSANNDIQALAREAGADAYLSKPFELEDLRKITVQLMG